MRTSNIVKEAQSSQEVSESAIAMSIDEGSSVFLMDALGKLYSRPAQAVLREYLSNALDAHKAKGGKLPAVQVRLPGNGNPVKQISVRDFGHGMSEKDVKDILSRYGASTKRDNNEMIGGFGLGAKSGFAISNEFFITSFQQGYRVRYRIFKNALNQGFVDAIERSSTNEWDGLLVEVPVPEANLHEIHSTTLNDCSFFLGYSHDEIHVNVPTGVFVAGSKAFTPLELGNETVGWLSRGGGSGKKLLALIGKVSYVIDTTALKSFASENEKKSNFPNILSGLMSFQRDKVINVPIGSLDLPSAREEISYTERSINTLITIITNYVTLAKAAIQKELNQIESLMDVLSFLGKLQGNNYPYLEELSWRGSPLSLETLRQSRIVRATVSATTRYNARQNSVSTGIGCTDFSRLKNMQSLTTYGNGVYLIKVDSHHEIAPLKDKFFNEKVLIAFLKSKNINLNKKAIFLLYSEDDTLNDWIIQGVAVDASELHEIAERLKEEEKLEEERQKQEALKKAQAKEQARLAAREQALALHESKLSYFGLQSDMEALIRDDKQRILTSPHPLYYWSMEEIFRFANTSLSNLRSDQHILFPFFTQSKTPNQYSLSNNTEAKPSYPYIVKLRLFLKMFLPEDSMIVVLGREKNLAQFQMENPSVKSGILTVKAAVAADFEREHPMLADAYNSILTSNNLTDVEGGIRSTALMQNLAKFASSISETEKGKLNGQLGEVVARLPLIEKVAESQQEWEPELFRIFLNGFTDVDIREQNLSLLSEIETLSEKYPLLLEGTFKEYNEKVAASMFNYIHMCEELAPVSS